ncbi:hypothetical protein SNOG_10642 [Parastagonospora nodorum SN15]|uniref:Uncharacterized protein n=1 Tax=Phaeosphaeria nodorum (strain SN15 / ATCC MYA-4574 / FGSC 10173) TaxID=321614 RepID=Q0UC72_PHANO|nr:hypothetical protein SNOG_10642 [Parastagonospora nodorum SN15]EAT82036.1 hypothetical protein SNOG_10642 [Parastagonospora nodorum SN15]
MAYAPLILISPSDPPSTRARCSSTVYGRGFLRLSICGRMRQNVTFANRCREASCAILGTRHMVSSAPRRYRCRPGVGIRGGFLWRCTSNDYAPAWNRPGVRRILLCPPRAALLVRTRGLDGSRSASPLARRLTEASPPCAPFCLLTRWRFMHEICLFAAISQILLAICRRPATPLHVFLAVNPTPAATQELFNRCRWRKAALVNSWARHSAIDAPTPPDSSVSRMKMCATCFTVPFAGGAMQSPDEHSAKANLISALGDEWTTSH